MPAHKKGKHALNSHQYDPKEYEFVEFTKSDTAHKKYDAILENKETHQTVRVPFGDKRYEHFEDRTGLGLYSDQDHGDEKRKESYHKRHAKEKGTKYSPGYFAMEYLW